MFDRSQRSDQVGMEVRVGRDVAKDPVDLVILLVVQAQGLPQGIGGAEIFARAGFAERDRARHGQSGFRVAALQGQGENRENRGVGEQQVGFGVTMLAILDDEGALIVQAHRIFHLGEIAEAGGRQRRRDRAEVALLAAEMHVTGHAEDAVNVLVVAVIA